MIVSLSLGLLLITGLTQSLPYPQEIHVQNIDQILNSTSTNQSSSNITTQSPEIIPIDVHLEHEHHHDQHDNQEKIELSKDSQASGRSLDSTTNFDTNSGLLTSIFLNPAVRPTEQSTHVSMMTTKSDESSTDLVMIKDENEPMLPKQIPENINQMDEMQMNQTENGKELNEGQNDQPIMDDEIIPEKLNENMGHNTDSGNRKYTEINRDNQYLPINRDNQYLPINNHNNQYLPINNQDHHQYSTVESTHDDNMHHNYHEHDTKDDMHQTHADIKESTEIRYDYTETVMLETTSATSNMRDNKSDDENKINVSKPPQHEESKVSSGNKLETIYKFGKITLLLYITFLCL